MVAGSERRIGTGARPWVSVTGGVGVGLTGRFDAVLLTKVVGSGSALGRRGAGEQGSRDLDGHRVGPGDQRDEHTLAG